jgi:hypothetical protein
MHHVKDLRDSLHLIDNNPLLPHTKASDTLRKQFRAL